jgi:hypothetical protein
MLIAMEGTAVLQRSAGSKSSPQVMELLHEGDKLTIDDDKRLELVFFQDGHRESLMPSASVVVKKRGCEPADAVTVRLAPASSKKAMLDGLGELGNRGQAAAVVFRSSQSRQSPALVTPIDGSAVVDDRPAFTWPASEEAKGYEVVLSRVGSYEQIFKAESDKPQLPFPSEGKSLVRGRKYQWRVSAKTSNSYSKPLIDAYFTVVGREECELLETLKPLIEGTDPTEWLLAACAFESYGADAEALAQYQRLATALPQVGAIQAARAALLERAGRQQEAQEARVKAESLGFSSAGQKASAPDQSNKVDP